MSALELAAARGPGRGPDGTECPAYSLASGGCGATMRPAPGRGNGHGPSTVWQCEQCGYDVTVKDGPRAGDIVALHQYNSAPYPFPWQLAAWRTDRGLWRLRDDVRGTATGTYVDALPGEILPIHPARPGALESAALVAPLHVWERDALRDYLAAPVDGDGPDGRFTGRIASQCPGCGTAPAYRTRKPDPWDTHDTCPACGYCYTHGH